MKAAFVVSALALTLASTGARAQFTDSGVTWSMSGPAPGQMTAALQGSALLASAAVAAHFVWRGATLTVPVVRGISAGAAVMAPIGRAILREAISKQALTGAALAAALMMTGDTTYDAGTNSFVFAPPTQTGTYSGSSVTCQTAKNAGMQPGQDRYFVHTNGVTKVHVMLVPETGKPGTTPPAGYSLMEYCTTTYPNVGGYYSAIFQKNVTTIPATAPPVPATDAQIEAAIAAKPEMYVPLWEIADCSGKVTSFSDFRHLTAGDPCARIVGEGSVVPAYFPQGVDWTWAGPELERITRENAAGQTVTETKAVSKSVTVGANTGADARTKPITATVTTTTTVTTDDGTTVTTETTTTTHPAEGVSSEAPPAEAAIPFSGPTADLYTKKSKTFEQVLNRFRTTVQAAPWYSGTASFFEVSIGGGACPNWVIPETEFTPAVSLADVFCSSTALAVYGIAGLAVLTMAAWAAFRIAFL